MILVKLAAYTYDRLIFELKLLIALYSNDSKLIIYQSKVLSTSLNIPPSMSEAFTIVKLYPDIYEDIKSKTGLLDRVARLLT